jgi:hypothetical protein
MHCYYHQDREAVGGCKSCGKGLCAECAVDLGKGLACRGRCEADAQAVIDLVQRNIALAPTYTKMRESMRESTKTTRYSTAIFNLVIGAVFTLWGAVESERFALILVLGLCFIGYGCIGIFQARKLSK